MVRLTPDELRLMYPALLEHADIECQEGWADLIRIACDALSNERFKGVQIFQIKEKFGQLRINLAPGVGLSLTDKYIDELWSVLESVERLSRYFCEFCGDVRGVTTASIPTGAPYGWIKTLCTKCRGKVDEERASRVGTH